MYFVAWFIDKQTKHVNSRYPMVGWIFKQKISYVSKIYVSIYDKKNYKKIKFFPPEFKHFPGNNGQTDVQNNHRIAI